MSCAAPKVPREIARVSDLPYRSDSAGFAPLRMRHMSKDKPKIVKKCDLPLTSARPVSVVVTELAVIDFPEGRARLCETTPWRAGGTGLGEFGGRPHRPRLRSDHDDLALPIAWLARLGRAPRLQSAA